MKQGLLLFAYLFIANVSQAQKVDSIYFHLYTDSLKKGFYNYINVDGKTTDGRWFPLSSAEVNFTIDGFDSLLYFKNNDLFIDSAYLQETVKVTAQLKANPAVKKEVIIYIRKRGFDEPLSTNQQVLENIRKERRKGN